MEHWPFSSGGVALARRWRWAPVAPHWADRMCVDRGSDWPTRISLQQLPAVPQLRGQVSQCQLPKMGKVSPPLALPAPLSDLSFHGESLGFDRGERAVVSRRPLQAGRKQTATPTSKQDPICFRLDGWCGIRQCCRPTRSDSNFAGQPHYWCRLMLSSASVMRIPCSVSVRTAGGLNFVTRWQSLGQTLGIYKSWVTFMSSSLKNVNYMSIYLFWKIIFIIYIYI